jgi:Histidine kinase-, DNA gyrase B-, and HSP90-like ATPase
VPEGGRFRVYTTGHGLSDQTIFTLGEDQDSNPWMGTLTGGAIKLVRHGFTAYSEGDGLEPTHIVSVFENQAGELCVISNGWLINLFDGTRFTAIRPNVPARFASEIFPGRAIEFGFETALPQQELRLSADARRQIFLIFKECVHNMVRHSGCTRADLEVRTDGEGLLMQLRDNGRGFDLSVVKDGHGLTSMQRRAASLGGELHIASNKGEGTIVTLAVPFGQLSLRQA